MYPDSLNNLFPRYLKEPSVIEQSIFNAMSEMLVFYDIKLKILWANSTACRSVDPGSESIIGQYCYKVWQNRTAPCEGCPLLEVMKTGEPQSGRVTTLQNRILHVRGYPVFDDQSNIVGLLEFKEDVTERVRAEEDLKNYNELLIKEQSLRESEERFKAIFSMVPDPIILTRVTDGTIIDCNQALVNMLDIPYEKILGRSTLEFCVWKSQKEREAFLQEIRDRGFLEKKELLWRDNTGKDLHILFSSRVIEIHGEKIIISVGFDYTSIKLAEESLRESEEMFRNPVENSPVGIFLYQNGFFRYANKHLAMMFGHSRENFLDTPIDSLFSPSDSHLIGTTLQKRDNRQPHTDHLEIQGIRSDGMTLDLELYASRTQFRGKPAIFGTIIDVSEKKQIEIMRLASEGKYRLITEHMKDVVWILDLDTWLFTYVSPSVKRLRGYSAQEVLENPFADALMPGVSDCFKESIQKSFVNFLKNTSKIEFNVTELEQPCKDGSTVMTEVVTNFFINKETGKIEILGVSRDISERKKAEKELERKTLELYGKNEELCAANQELCAIEEERRDAYEALEKHQQALKISERSLKKAQGIAHLGVWEWDIADNQVYVSDEFSRILGLYPATSPPAYIDFYNMITQPYQDQFDNSMKILIESGIPFSLEFWIIRDDGIKRALRGQGEIDRDYEGTSGHLTLIVQDITDHKRMEEEIQEASLEKEILLREIHHRVKNNMQVISSLISMQSRSIQDPIIKTLFNETQSRVRSLSLVHELLYKSENLNSINYRRYLQILSNYLLDSYNISKSDIKCIIPENNVIISIDKAVPCSLIINELITNSLKYGFKGGKKGEIIIDFTFDPDTSEYILHYRDDGLGFSEKVNPVTNTGFGTTLIHGLTNQLSGSVTVENGRPGVHYTIIFPETIVKK